MQWVTLIQVTEWGTFEGEDIMLGGGAELQKKEKTVRVQAVKETSSVPSNFIKLTVGMLDSFQFEMVNRTCNHAPNRLAKVAESELWKIR